MRYFRCLLLLLLLAAVLPARGDETGAAPPPALKHATILEASFDYPAELILTAKKGRTGAQVNLKLEEGLPWILVQEFSVPMEPKEALGLFEQEHKKRFAEKKWPVTVHSVQEMIAGKVCQGRELAFRGEAASFRQRFYELRQGGRTIIVMVMTRSEEDELARRLLAPIASSLKVTPDPRLAQVQKTILYIIGGGVLLLIVGGGVLIAVLVRKSRGRALPPPLPPVLPSR